MGGVYSTRQTAKTLKLQEKTILLYARAGVVAARQGNRYIFDFRDLAVLRQCRRLAAQGFSHHRLVRSLATLRRTLGDRPLSAVELSSQGERLIARHGTTVWDVESRQHQLPLEAQRNAAVVQRLAFGLGPNERPTFQTETQPLELPDDLASAQGWFEVALDLEEIDPKEAYYAYLRVLACNPEHVEAMINVGRLCAAAQDCERAAMFFRQAIRVAPSMAVAHFNLGVTLHDSGDAAGAILAYRTALIHDPHFADAHYNLATLLEQQGDRRGALQHMAAYRVASEQSPRT